MIIIFVSEPMMQRVKIVGGHVLQSQTFFKRAFVTRVALKKSH